MSPKCLQTAQLFRFLLEIWWLVASAKEFNIHRVKQKIREEILHLSMHLRQMQSLTSPLSCQRRTQSGPRATHKAPTRREIPTISLRAPFPGLIRAFSHLWREHKIMCKIMDRQVKCKTNCRWTRAVLLSALRDSRRSSPSSGKGAAPEARSLSQLSKFLRILRESHLFWREDNLKLILGPPKQIHKLPLRLLREQTTPTPLSSSSWRVEPRCSICQADLWIEMPNYPVLLFPNFRDGSILIYHNRWSSQSQFRKMKIAMTKAWRHLSSQVWPPRNSQRLARTCARSCRRTSRWSRT